MNGIFTAYDTVLFDDGTEMFNEKYFGELEKGIHSGKITNCKYDAKSMTFEYLKDDIDEYTINTEKCKSDTIGEINKLTTLEKLRRDAENMKAEAKERKRKQEEEDEMLIEEASKGNILSERARQLYLAKLNDELKHLGKFELLNDSEDKFEFEFNAMSFTLFGALVWGLIGWAGMTSTTGIAKIIYTACLIKGIYNFCIPWIDKTSLLSKLIAAAGANIKKLWNCDKYEEKREIIKHKIEWLEHYNITGEEIITTHLSKINVLLRELDDENRIKFDNELTGENQKYQTALINSATDGLNINNEEYIRLTFNSYLTRLEYRIDSVKNGATYEDTIEKENSKIAPIDHSLDPKSEDLTRKLTATM